LRKQICPNEGLVDIHMRPPSKPNLNKFKLR